MRTCRERLSAALPLAASARRGERGRPDPALHFTAAITLEPTSSGTRYRALAIHPDPETCKQHAEMGFHDGRGSALDQLVGMVKGRAIA